MWSGGLKNDMYGVSLLYGITRCVWWFTTSVHCQLRAQFGYGELPLNLGRRL